MTYGNPKNKKVKLSEADYHLLRLFVYNEQWESCKGCLKWKRFNEFSLHHKDRAVGDVRSNVDGYCLGCHPE